MRRWATDGVRLIPRALSFGGNFCFCRGHARITPRPILAYQLYGFVRPPASRSIGIKWRHVLENGLHDPPLSVHDVLAPEQIAVAMHRVTEQPLVRRTIIRGPGGEHQLRVVANHPLARLFDAEAHADGHVG